MSWMIQSMNEGPIILSDVGITMTRGQIRDLDLIGRENAERSNDIKLALMKGWIKELRKDAHSASGIDPKIVQQMQEAASKANHVAEQLEQVTADQKQTIGKLEESNKRLGEELEAQKATTAEVLSNTKQLMTKMQEMIDQDPLRMRAIKEAIANIKVEQVAVSKEQKELAASGDSEAEIKAREKILQMKEKKLKKNYDDIGRTMTDDSSQIDEALDALDSLGI